MKYPRLLLGCVVFVVSVFIFSSCASSSGGFTKHPSSYSKSKKISRSHSGRIIKHSKIVPKKYIIVNKKQKKPPK